jgi:hypothetical protein
MKRAKMIFTSKTMILGCALAMIIGASLVSSLMFFNTVLNPFPENPPTTPNPQSSNSQIAETIENVYLELGERSVLNGSSFKMYTQPTFSGSIDVSATKYLNDNQNIPDAEVDYFHIQIFFENGTAIENFASIENFTFHCGAAYNRSFITKLEQDQNVYQMLDSSEKAMGLTGTGGTFRYLWSIGTSIPNGFGFSGTISQSFKATLENTQSLTLILSRIGSVTIKGNSSIVSTSDAGIIETIQLVRHGNGFMYNKDGSSTPIALPNFNFPHPTPK